MEFPIDLGLLDVDMCNGQSKIRSGDTKGGMAILLSILRTLRTADYQEADGEKKREMRALFIHCADIILEAMHKVQLEEPKSFLSNQADKGINVEDLILTPDESLFFKDLTGCRDVKLALLEAVVLPVLFPGYIPDRHRWSGVLLFGLPGTGKSKVLKALVNTVLRTLGLDMTFVQVTSADVLGNFHGDSERNITKIFDSCAKMIPCVVLIDEVDSLTGSREMTAQGSEVKMINHLLSLLDGIKGTTPVVVIGTTNLPYNLDHAFLRRFPCKAHLDLPNKTERAEIIQAMLQRLEGIRISTDVDVKEISEFTFRFSPADLCILVTRAVQRVLCNVPAQNILTKLESGSPMSSLHGVLDGMSSPTLSMSDFKFARRQVMPSCSERDVSKLERFVNDHCPKHIDLDAIEVDFRCCTSEEFTRNPIWETVLMCFRCLECFCEGC